MRCDISTAAAALRAQAPLAPLAQANAGAVSVSAALDAGVALILAAAACGAGTLNHNAGKRVSNPSDDPVPSPLLGLAQQSAPDSEARPFACTCSSQAVAHSAMQPPLLRVHQRAASMQHPHCSSPMMGVLPYWSTQKSPPTQPPPIGSPTMLLSSSAQHLVSGS